MLDPFRLRGTFGADYSVDGDDILRTKKALNKLGHFDDKESINPYADNRMIDGLKSFQRVRGLEPDGIMKPDGPTARELSKALAESDTRPHQRGLVAEGRFDPPSRHLPTTLPTRKPHRPQARPWDEHLPTEDALFRLLGDVGRGRRNDPRDVLTIRRALGWAGDLAPKKGLEELGADDDLFAAIDRFQARTGAKRDGWMGKGGETEKALNTEIFPKVKAQAAPPHNDLDGGRESEEEAEVALWDKVLQQGLRLLPGLAGGAAAQKAAEEIQKNAPNEQREMTPPPAPVPPNRPPGLHVPDRTETPAKAPVMDLDLTRPLPEATEPTIFINPVLPDYMQTAGTIVDRNETEATKAQIDRIRDEFRNKNPELDHIFGGRDAITGAEKKEYYSPGPGYGLPRPSRKTGDGRKRSGYTDLTFASKDRKTFWHIQTVDVDKNGKPTSRELENAERIRRGLQDKPDEVHHIILVPKPGPIRPGR